MKAQDRFTTSEAAYVLGEKNLKSFKKTLDEHKPGEVVTSNGIKTRVLGRADLIGLVALKQTRETLTPKARRAFWIEFKTSAPAGRQAKIGAVSVDLKAAKSELQESLRRYNEALSLIKAGPSGGDAILKGTDIEAHRIAALLAAGISSKDVRREYPSLSDAQIEASRVYAAANPKSGRPYPTRTLKQAIRQSGLGNLDAMVRAAESEE